MIRREEELCTNRELKMKKSRDHLLTQKPLSEDSQFTQTWILFDIPREFKVVELLLVTVVMGSPLQALSLVYS